jgi:hypothetical protein
MSADGRMGGGVGWEGMRMNGMSDNGKNGRWEGVG